MHGKRPSLSTTAPFGFRFDMPRFLEAYHSLGCATAQFYRNPENEPSAGEALRVIGAAGMRFDSIHGVFGPGIDPSSPDAGHRDECLRVYESEARLALELGAPMVVTHPSANLAENKVYGVQAARQMEERRWNGFEDFALRLGEIGQRLGVTFLIENVTYSSPLGHGAAELGRRLIAMDHPRLRMCFDTGHAHLTGDAASSLRACAPVVEYVHLHDNDGSVDDHRMPGDGSIEWPGLVEAMELAPGAIRMIEVFYTVERVEEMARHGLGSRLAELCGAR